MDFFYVISILIVEDSKLWNKEDNYWIPNNIPGNCNLINIKKSDHLDIFTKLGHDLYFSKLGYDLNIFITLGHDLDIFIKIGHDLKSAQIPRTYF